MNFLNKLLKLFLLIFVIGCSSSDDSSTTLKAVFSLQQNEDNLLKSQTVNFINNSTGPNELTYFWEFGDGQTSTLKNPTHIFEEIGSYTVKLTVSGNSQSNSTSKKLLICLSNEIPGRSTLLNKFNSSGDKIMVCAHRGGHEIAPENSLASISEAINNGIGMVELDIRKTKDGVLVAMHDATINRTTNGTGSISNLTYQELQQFNLKGPNNSITNEKIPTFAQILDLCRGQVYIAIDSYEKSPPLEVYEMVKQYGMLNQVLIYTNRTEFSSIHLKDPTILAMPSIRTQSEFDTYSNTNYSVKVVHYHDETFNTNFMNQARNKGWSVFRNAYVNTSSGPSSDGYAKINQIISLKGKIIQTDYTVLTKNHLVNLNLYLL